MCEPEGWIKIHRKMLKWEWYDDINVKTIFIHCLLKANYKDKSWKGTIVKRGSFITSDEHLALETKMSRQEVRTAIGKLISTNEIHKQATNKYTILSVINYDTYQSNGTDEQPSSNQPATNEQPTNNQPVTTTKEYKEREENKESTSTTRATEILKFNPELFLNKHIVKNHSRLFLEFPDLLNDSWHDRLTKTYNQEDLIEALKQLNNKMKSGQYHCLGTTIETWVKTVENSKKRNQFKGNPNEYNQRSFGNNNSKGSTTQYNQPKSRGATVSERNERFNELLPTIEAIGNKHS